MTQRASWLETGAWLFLVLLGLFPLAGCHNSGADGPNGTAAARDPEVLNVALLPDEAASKLIQDNQALKVYLEKGLGKPVNSHALMNNSPMSE